MRVAAIDAANVSGWAVLERLPGAGREQVVGRGRFRLGDRATAVVITAVDTLAAYSPDVVAIEVPYVGINAVTALSLSELVGRFRQELERRGLATSIAKADIWQRGVLAGLITHSSPRAARKSAAKTWVRGSFGLTVTEDEADAIGLAAWVLRTRSNPALVPTLNREGRQRRPKKAA